MHDDNMTPANREKLLQIRKMCGLDSPPEPYKPINIQDIIAEHNKNVSRGLLKFRLVVLGVMIVIVGLYFLLNYNPK